VSKQKRSRTNGGEGEGPSGSESPGRPSWFRTHGRDLKFLVIFGLLMTVYYVVVTSDRVENEFFPWYLQKNAEVSGWVVHRFGYDDM
jgi:hypothetical protein